MGHRRWTMDDGQWTMAHHPSDSEIRQRSNYHYVAATILILQLSQQVNHKPSNQRCP